MQIIINVPPLPASAGTVTTVIEYLQTVQLHIKNNQRGNLCLFARTPEFDEIVALYVPDFDEKIRSTYTDYENCYFAPSPGRTDLTVANNGHSLFGPLTPAAWAIVQDFLTQCVETLKAVIETDGLGQSFSVRVEIV